jgi:hypothetical protein
LNERGMSYVLTFGPERQRIKIADVGIVPLKDARIKAKTILAEKQLGILKPEAAPTFDEAKNLFLTICESKNKPRTVRGYTRLLNRHFAFGKKPANEITPSTSEDRRRAEPCARGDQGLFSTGAAPALCDTFSMRRSADNQATVPQPRFN